MFGLDAFITQLGGQATALNMASTLFNVFGSQTQSDQQGAMYDYQATRAEQQAAIDRGMGEVMAGRLRTAGKRDVSKVTAQYAGAGVDIGSGSAAEVGAELSRRVELDALSAMLSGKYKAYDNEVAAGQYRTAAANSRTGGKWGAGASLLGGLSRQGVISGWGNKTGAAASGGWTDAGSTVMEGMA